MEEMNLFILQGRTFRIRMLSGQSTRLHSQWQQLLPCCQIGPSDLSQGHSHNRARLKMTCDKAIWMCKIVICTQKKEDSEQ